MEGKEICASNGIDIALYSWSRCQRESEKGLAVSEYIKEPSQGTENNHETVIFRAVFYNMSVKADIILELQGFTERRSPRV